MLDPTAPRADGTYLTWRGNTYLGSMRPRGTAVLLSTEPDEGFTPRRLGRGFEREVSSSEVEVWTLRTRATFRGRRLPVLTWTESEVVLACQGMGQDEAESLGAVMVDRGVFDLTVPASEVTDLRQERSTA